MSSLLSSRWAPGASESASYSSRPLRRPRSENRIRSTATPPTNNGNEYRYNHTHNYGSSKAGPVSGPGSGSVSGSPLPPAEELSRFMKIVARLRWKLPFLAEGYRLATLAVDGVNVSGEEVAHSEIMFKIDFHEYYALLERAIVHLLAVFNISVSSVGGRSGSGVQVGGGGGGAGVHRFHANVLQALQEESTPLAPVLGTGYVHELLKKAKELRNRWKGADMTDQERERDPFEMGKKILPLASFDFDEILTGIFGGLEEAYIRARAHVDLCKKPGDSEEERTDVESDWGFMVDAMDWEAV
ncbi:hypothetical protein N7456_013495 [Penicillium angulare]|uniref:Fungal specific transcription factor n=1 Tax=Penicillium angulare TaxID=116970 RepID=A0A9W9JU25_9EURO|nr:hypothetical protein N7456_013495 [Penicillium angulare]